MEKSVKSLLDKIQDTFELQPVMAKQYSPLTLAYIGDAIYDLIIRTMLVEHGNAPVNKLHRKASSFVKAEAQARLIHQIEDELTEEELAIYKRGRNAKSATSAKNASVLDYRTATGFEALMGYLYLDNQIDRALWLVQYGLEKEKNSRT
ncbi:Mini-ribonuclease 3 [Velocimicrobium porci]|uniref:Mini-ribonuclease 3 n=1 Tax=Velocimicrobium porci TaxID=2606634 RepID=A0A6L5XVC5_9FIRM|nr:ribonuclease III domain-containing protein [Velocimicrobium porci]MSS62662.1 ribonuclease III [Velocimicrobium porci]